MSNSTEPGTVPATRWWVLATIGIAQLMVVLDTSIVNIALPSAQADLGFSDSARQWVVTAYALAFAALLLLGGRLSDLFGRKRAFLVGIVGFAAASALGGAAGSFGILVTARTLQGAFAALLAPAALSLLNTTFTDPHERTKAFGVFGAIGASGTVVGLLVGGALTQVLDWRATMYVNVVFSAIALAGGALLLSNRRDAAGAALDLPGTILVSAGLFSLVFGFSNVGTYAWSSPLTWGFLLAGVVLVTAFAGWQTRARHPLLPLRVLTDRDRAASFATLLITGAALFGVLLFLTYYLQHDLGFGPIETGLAFLPMIAVMMVVAQVATGKIVPRTGPKIVLPIGYLLGAVGLVWLARITVESRYPTDVLPPLLLIGAALGSVIPPAISLATAGVAAADAGVTSATVNAMQQVGGSIGTAVLNTLATSAAASYLVGKDATDPAVVTQSDLAGYSTAFAWAAGLFLTGGVVTAVVYRRKSSGRDES
ncbi:MFS transporter [Amycolatopsis solani]|uniref:MFS transporter n=1 Tax=Amycolatopsis solani TaxID=3028615 RepID=UPI0025B0F60D|nr:MFS transporter [Amycolatopsis sp. MEP2-6]